MTTRSHDCDVIVVGGGPAGCSTAIGLRSHGLTVTIVEPAIERGTRIGETVPPEIGTLLERLGVSEAFERQNHLPSDGRKSAWGTSELTYSDGFCNALGGGWHLDRAAFETMLLEQALDRGARLARARAVDIGALPDGGWHVVAAAAGIPTVLRTTLLVDATGAAARVSRKLGAGRLEADRLLCAYAVFEGLDEDATPNLTLVESECDGWWYVSPLPRGRAMAAFFGDARVFRSRRLAEAGSWYEFARRTKHVLAALGAAPAPAEIRTVATASQCLDRPAGADWVAVGDAAAALDPLCSAGLALALRSGLDAADSLALRRDGDATATARYAADVQKRFRRYLIERRAFYALETRWRDSPFWRSRTSSPRVRRGASPPAAAGARVLRSASTVARER
jgi:flavin-dependent dehydrogenase